MRLIDADSLMESVAKKKPETATVRYTEGFNDAIGRVRSMIHSAPTCAPLPDAIEYWDEQSGKTVIIAEMRACPFCGSKSLSFGGFHGIRVMCDDCKSVGPSVLQCPSHSETLREAASKWNKRIKKAGEV